ncbi:glutathione S-transferase family protein [Kaustia mangrovi]|uniref:Glutathione S-transferase family protein n=1 Tax=Kaustia mangrovi TaxID=2593653 RepID=A0A7S8C7Y6_9HYPH|nr:glutathione S-transferase family protein [Kaustia mangrovi]QPC44871.1 glutathione S-transferase family protein [Kaustia mangrovi]
MKLYWAPQSRSSQALRILEEAGAEYERVTVDIRAGGQDDPAFRAINPMGKVPVLEDEGVIVAESAAICAHVADRFPQAGLAPPPGDPMRGAYFRWLFFGPSCIEPAIVQKVTGLDIDKATAGWGSYALVLDTLEEALSSVGPWILGETYSAADVVIGSGLNFGMMFELIEPRAAFSAYVERFRARPAIQRATKIELQAGA